MVGINNYKSSKREVHKTVSSEQTTGCVIVNNKTQTMVK